MMSRPRLNYHLQNIFLSVGSRPVIVNLKKCMLISINKFSIKCVVIQCVCYILINLISFNVGWHKKYSHFYSSNEIEALIKKNLFNSNRTELRNF